MTEPVQEGLTEARPQPPGPAEPPYDLAAVVAEYETPLLRYAGQLLGRDAARGAEDVVQEAFLRLHRQIAQRGRSSVRNLSSWLFRVTHNLALDTVRKRRREDRGRERAARQGGLTAESRDDAVDALGEMMHREACDRALDELHKLPDEQQHVLLLKIVQGMNLREIGEVTGLTPGNAAYRIDRGLRELARRLKAGGVI